MQLVYTKHVIPEEMLELWHSSANEKLQTVVKDGQDHAEMIRAWIDLFLIRLLRVDTHPTLSRFFSFRGVVDRMLTMSLLNWLKRVTRVRHFLLNQLLVR